MSAMVEPPVVVVVPSEQDVVVRVDTPPPVLVVVPEAAETDVELAEVAQVGPPGPVGPSGPAGRDGADGIGAPLELVVATPAATWTWEHGLGRYPEIVLFCDPDTTERVYTLITYPDRDTAVVTWARPESGRAYTS